jgi:hypothetical protein
MLEISWRNIPITPKTTAFRLNSIHTTIFSVPSVPSVV